MSKSPEEEPDPLRRAVVFGPAAMAAMALADRLLPSIAKAQERPDITNLYDLAADMGEIPTPEKLKDRILTVLGTYTDPAYVKGERQDILADSNTPTRIIKMLGPAGHEHEGVFGKWKRTHDVSAETMIARGHRWSARENFPSVEIHKQVGNTLYEVASLGEYVDPQSSHVYPFYQVAVYKLKRGAPPDLVKQMYEA